MASTYNSTKYDIGITDPTTSDNIGMMLKKENVLEKRRKKKIRGKEEDRYALENHYATFYNARNEVLGRMFVKIYATLRDYGIVFEKFKKGDAEARSQLVELMKRQEKKLSERGRTPKYSLKELIKDIDNSRIETLLLKLDDFFSLWD